METHNTHRLSRQDFPDSDLELEESSPSSPLQSHSATSIRNKPVSPSSGNANMNHITIDDSQDNGSDGTGTRQNDSHPQRRTLQSEAQRRRQRSIQGRIAANGTLEEAFATSLPSARRRRHSVVMLPDDDDNDDDDDDNDNINIVGESINSSGATSIPQIHYMPNINTHDDGPGASHSAASAPILIESDDEDISVHSASVSTSESPSSRLNMALNADDRSIRLAQAAQRRHIQRLTNEMQQQRRQRQQQRDGATVDDTDEVQFVAERPVPDIQILSSRETERVRASPGFDLYTPSGPLFVPVESEEQTRRGGGRVHMTLGRDNGDSSDDGRGGRVSSNSRFWRPVRDNRASQQQLRERQMEANRRARAAAAAAQTPSIADRVHSRSTRRPAPASSNEHRNVRPRLTHEMTNNHIAAANSGVFHLLSTLAPHNARVAAAMNMFESMGARQIFGHRFYMPTAFEAQDGMTGMGGDLTSDEIPDHVMRILQSRDEEREAQRVSARTKLANAERDKKAKDAAIPAELRSEYSNNLGEDGHTDICVLCGVTLLEGIPEKNTDIENRDDEIKQFVKEGIISPWQAWRKCSKEDIGLSKKVFFGTCGHIYCGRCVSNIMKFRGLTARQRRDALNKERIVSKDRVSAATTDFENPAFSAPLKCIAKNCGKKFAGQTPFNELYP